MSFDEAAREVGSTVDRRIRRLQSLSEHPRRAALANLRRGVGRAPGELPELWGSFLADMPEEFFRQRRRSVGGGMGRLSRAHPLCAAPAGADEAHVRTGGRAWPGPCAGCLRTPRAAFTAASAPWSPPAAWRRFRTICAGLIQLLRDKSLPLDYPQLARDLYRLQFPQSAPGVKLQWGQEYFSRKDADGQQEDSDDRQEKEDTDE